MVKAIAVSMIVVCLVGSTALGGLLNEETWVLGLGDAVMPNSLALSGAPGTATQITGIGALNIQTSSSAQDGLLAGQGFGAALLQGATATNLGAADIRVEQAGATAGVLANGKVGQAQEIQEGTDGLLTQSEGATLLGAQAIDKTGGAGSATAGNGGGVIMGQFGASAAQGATVGQGSVMIGAQYSTVAGAPGSAASTYASMTGTVLQAQQID